MTLKYNTLFRILLASSIALALSMVFTANAQDTGTVFKISGTTGPFGDVLEAKQEFQITQDNRVVFVSDREDNQVFDLWVSDIEPSATPQKLSSVLSDVRFVDSFKLSPNERAVAYEVVFQASGNVEAAIEIFDFNRQQRLINFASGANFVADYKFSPDSKRLAFATDSSLFGGGTILGSVEVIDTSNRVTAYFDQVRQFEFIDNETVVVLARSNSSDYHLYRMSLVTGVFARINSTDLGAVAVDTLKVNATLDTVIVNSVANGLQAVSLADDSVTDLNPPSKNCSQVKFLNFRNAHEVFVECLVTYDLGGTVDRSSNVLRFVLDQDQVFDFLVYADNDVDIYINERIQSWRYAPEAGLFFGTRIHETFGVGIPDSTSSSFMVSEGGQETVVASQFSRIRLGFFDVDFSRQGSSMLLQEVGLENEEFTGARLHQLYQRNTADNSVNLLRETKRSVTPFKYVDFYHELSTDPEYFIFSQRDKVVSVRFPEQINVYRQRYSDGQIVRLNAPFIPGGNVTDFKVSPDGRFLVYRGDQLSDDRFELFAVEYREVKEDDDFCFLVITKNGSTTSVCL